MLHTYWDAAQQACSEAYPPCLGGKGCLFFMNFACL